jgi:hypothetical protein
MTHNVHLLVRFMRFHCFWLLLCLAFFVQPAQAEIYRCDGPRHADGSANILFQSKPCPVAFDGQLVREPKAPAYVAPLVRHNSSSQVRNQTRVTRRNSAGNRVARRSSAGGSRSARKRSRYKFRNLPSVAVAGCPPTYEDPGVYVVGNKWMRDQHNQRSKARNGMFAAWQHYKSLPTKTYLKNQGLWPKHCPD